MEDAPRTLAEVPFKKQFPSYVEKWEETPTAHRLRSINKGVREEIKAAKKEEKELQKLKSTLEQFPKISKGEHGYY